MPAATAAPLVEFTGVLMEPAKAVSRAADRLGHFEPVLCLVLELEDEHRTRMVVQQPFPPHAFAQAEAAARRHKPGERVRVEVPLGGLRLMAPNAAHIHVLKPQQE
ncbi:MAG: hypothetical protein J0H69_19645 [Burkholderiales bacterium]|nr:hypothetical protein [Burkholderiales bacterium]